jgi:hypothetical protein
MTERTCAACDCKLDSDPIKVKIGGKTVEVCCDDCAQKLRESQASVAGPGKGLTAVLAIGALSALFLAHPSSARASTAPSSVTGSTLIIGTSFAGLLLPQP